MNSHNAFAKNWLFRLSTAQPETFNQTPLLKLKRGLAWCGGLLVWLVLMLPAQAAVEMRVAISQGDQAISVGTSTTGIIKDGSGQALYRGEGAVLALSSRLLPNASRRTAVFCLLSRLLFTRDHTC